jgi:GAF domain-containing protein
MDYASDIAKIAMELNQQDDVEDTVAGIVRFAREALDCNHAGVHLKRGKSIETAASTDPVINKADQLQNDLGEGPCLSAIWTQDIYVVHDTATDDRWPRFAPLAAEMGLHSILSVRLQAAGETLGALNLYAHGVRDFTADDIAEATIFGRHASVALLSARREENLEAAIDARHLIGQAQGILMERFGLDADQAFGVLRRYSQSNNVKLRVVAERIVETRRLPD